MKNVVFGLTVCLLLGCSTSKGQYVNPHVDSAYIHDLKILVQEDLRVYVELVEKESIYDGKYNVYTLYFRELESDNSILNFTVEEIVNLSDLEFMEFYCCFEFEGNLFIIDYDDNSGDFAAFFDFVDFSCPDNLKVADASCLSKVRGKLYNEDGGYIGGSGPIMYVELNRYTHKRDIYLVPDNELQGKSIFRNLKFEYRPVIKLESE